MIQNDRREGQLIEHLVPRPHPPGKKFVRTTKNSSKTPYLVSLPVLKAVRRKSGQFGFVK